MTEFELNKEQQDVQDKADKDSMIVWRAYIILCLIVGNDFLIPKTIYQWLM